jgi:hypothetical protein
LFLASVLAAGHARASPMMRLEGFTLAGDAVSLPRDLASPRTLVIFSFDRLREEEVAGWRALAGREGAAHVTFVVVGERSRMARVAIGGRLRGEAPMTAPREAIVPLFLDAAVVRGAYGLSSDHAVQAVLLERAGTAAAVYSGKLPVSLVASPPATAMAAPTPSAEVAGVSGAHAPDTLLNTSPALPQAPTGDPVAPAQEVSQVAVVVAPASGPGLVPGPTTTAPRLIEGLTLDGVARQAGLPEQVVVLAASSAALGSLADMLVERARAKSCGVAGCLGLVALGAHPWPSRAIAAGRLRAQVRDAKLRTLIMPVFLDPVELFSRFGATPNVLAVVEPVK